MDEKIGNDIMMLLLLLERRNSSSLQKQLGKQEHTSALVFLREMPLVEHFITVMLFLNRMGHIRCTEN